MKVLTYIRQNVTVEGDNFVSQWGKLTDQDKTDLKNWARIEMPLRGVAVED